MGNCCSTDSEGRYQQGPGAGDGGGAMQAPGLTRVTMRPTKAAQQKQREATWQSTGIISLRDQKLTALPPLGAFADSGRVLDATNNQLKDVQALSPLVNLQKLTLSSNLIASLGDVLGSMVQLKLLVLDNNHLTSLPVQLGQLTKLEKLSVNNNKLGPSLPAGCLPPSLQILSLAHNQLAELPSTQLPAELEELDASNNRIQVIPVELRVLTKLKILNLDGNSVASVPPEVLSDCVSLHTLSLHNNPITPEALQSNPAFDAFEQRRRSKYDKVIQGGVLIGNKGLDEGVDRQLAK